MSANELHQHHRRAAEHAQRRAVWEFVSTVADWRCGLCLKSIDFGDLPAFGRTRLCPTCTHAVNDAFAGSSIQSPGRVS